jgi:hypothetical protein
MRSGLVGEISRRLFLTLGASLSLAGTDAETNLDLRARGMVLWNGMDVVDGKLQK